MEGKNPQTIIAHVSLQTLFQFNLPAGSKRRAQHNSEFGQSMKSENEINLPFFLSSLDLHDVYDLYQEQHEDNFSSTEMMSKEAGYFQGPQGKFVLVLL